jgi:xanthine dehydrogenase YagS FAD-binding subunit
VKPFAYTRPINAAAAIQAVWGQPSARFVAGGTNLVDLMKEGVENPELLVDINRLEFGQISETGDGVRLGALARNSVTANHPLVRQLYPLLTQAILAGASGQLRNAATNGGNLMQRTRCPYFYDPHQPCNKRAPGTGCGAWDGFNRIHAIFGWSDQCIATYPGDMANALVALDASVRVRGANGERTIPMAEFHRLPENHPERDSNLEHGELITAIDLPAETAKFASLSYYLKVRERASYAFALVAVAAALDVDPTGRIRDARVVLGSVAHKPWRSREAERQLVGNRGELAAFRAAAQAAMQDAKAFEHNRYKVELGRRAIVAALQAALEGGRQS